jgi:simple sugar transport system permease protein
VSARDVVTSVAIALLAALCATSILVLLYDESPARVYALMLARTFGDTYGFGQVLFRATPLVFTGLAVALCFKASLFNIGAEGQMAAGSMLTGMLGASLAVDTPALVAVPLCLLAGFVGGGLVGAIPGFLRARFGAHEVITTMMMNFVVASGILWLGRVGWFVEHTVHTAPVAPGARLPDLGLAGSAASVALFLALLAAVGVHVLVQRTRWGFELRLVGASPDAAAAAGVPVARRQLMTLALSGGLAGLVGCATVLGYKGFHEEGSATGAGFTGIAVSLLGRGHAAGVVAAALLFGWLSQGALAAGSLVPKEIVDVLQAVIIVSVTMLSAASLRRPS